VPEVAEVALELLDLGRLVVDEEDALVSHGPYLCDLRPGLERRVSRRNALAGAPGARFVGEGDEPHAHVFAILIPDSTWLGSSCFQCRFRRELCGPSPFLTSIRDQEHAALLVLASRRCT
jgi:hypothetical protein